MKSWVSSTLNQRQLKTPGRQSVIEIDLSSEEEEEEEFVSAVQQTLQDDTSENDSLDETSKVSLDSQQQQQEQLTTIPTIDDDSATPEESRQKSPPRQLTNLKPSSKRNISPDDDASVKKYISSSPSKRKAPKSPQTNIKSSSSGSSSSRLSTPPKSRGQRSPPRASSSARKKAPPCKSPRTQEGRADLPECRSASPRKSPDRKLVARKSVSLPSSSPRKRAKTSSPTKAQRQAPNEHQPSLHLGITPKEVSRQSPPRQLTNLKASSQANIPPDDDASVKRYSSSPSKRKAPKSPQTNIKSSSSNSRLSSTPPKSSRGRRSPPRSPPRSSSSTQKKAPPYNSPRTQEGKDTKGCRADLPECRSASPRKSPDRKLVARKSVSSPSSSPRKRAKTSSPTKAQRQAPNEQQPSPWIMHDDIMDCDQAEEREAAKSACLVEGDAAAVRSSETTNKDDTSSWKSSTVPSNKFLKSHCWACHVAVKKKENDPELCCLYAMHVHPILEVPTCSVCADAILAVETDVPLLEHPKNDKDEQHPQPDDTSSNYDPDRCSGCAKEEESVELLLLCDGCPRAFCLDCVAQSHGGSRYGALVAESTAKSEEDWICPCCDAPFALQCLRKELDDNNDNDTTIVTTEELMGQLEFLESELKQCEQIDEAYMNERRAEISSELEEECDTLEELRERVVREMEELDKKWKDHHLRIMDHVTSLMDELETRKINLLEYYKDRHNETLSPQSTEEEAEWKKMADQKLDKRDAESGIRKGEIPGGKVGSNPEVYDVDLGDEVEVEDLDIEDDAIPVEENKTASQKQWSIQQLPGDTERRREQIQKALRFEKMVIEENAIRVEQLNDDDDKAEIQSQQRITGGRVRRDELFILRRKANPAVQPSSNRGQSRRMNVAKKKQETPAVKEAKKRIVPSLVSDEIPPNQAIGGVVAFDNSGLILSSPEMMRQKGAVASEDDHKYRHVTVASHLSKILKEHQVDGIRFMWNNACSDLCEISNGQAGDSSLGDTSKVGGCILAHNMGLGKTLQAIALIHTLLSHPSLEHPGQEFAIGANRKRIISKVLIVVPANTISNWDDEWEKWVGGDGHLYNLNSVSKDARSRTIGVWATRGGVLLVTSSLFARVVKQDNMKPALQEPGPDIIVLDEAHTMVRSASTDISRALKAVRTKRRIALTGTPIQNNLMEYFFMANWVRPNCLGTERSFDETMNKPIMRGLSSDSSPQAVEIQTAKSKELYKKLLPFVHRRDNTALKKELKTMQQVVLHVRQSKMQVMLFRLFKRVYKTNSFLDAYHKLSPIQNHPGCLVLAARQQKLATSVNVPAVIRDTSRKELEPPVHVSPDGSLDRVLSDEESDEQQRLKISSTAIPQGKETAASGPVQPTETDEQWWEPLAAKHGVDKLMDITNGYKVVLLLQILAHSSAIGDKVVVFSKCLKTLNFLEQVLNQNDWGSLVPGIESISTKVGKLGPWQKNVDYLRIDGGVSPSARGELITSFNDKANSMVLDAAAVENSKLFLISIEAGGIGINLTAANRVILFDCHWNPAIMTQALYRCYRYGQSKPVFAYRFITEGSMEEKIYSRSVNKSGIAARVIDQRFPDRSFSDSDLDVLKENDSWACCDICFKWRMLPSEQDAEALPDKWYCEYLSECDPMNATCDAKERDQLWYTKRFERMREEKKKGSNSGGGSADIRESIDSPAYLMPDEAKSEAVRRDEILTKLLALPPETETRGKSPSKASSKKKKTKKNSPSFISKYYFHDVLLEDKSADLLDTSMSEGNAASKESGTNDVIAKHSCAKVQLMPDEYKIKDKAIPITQADSENSSTTEALPDLPDEEERSDMIGEKTLTSNQTDQKANLVMDPKKKDSVTPKAAQVFSSLPIDQPESSKHINDLQLAIKMSIEERLSTKTDTGEGVSSENPIEID